jgi:hypothetical protein
MENEKWKPANSDSYSFDVYFKNILAFSFLFEELVNSHCHCISQKVHINGGNADNFPLFLCLCPCFRCKKVVK